ncbi:MAG TPA: methylated-DNA--[protein]-cysteine S-methyltransferase [Solirubrobacterales bacterium]|nr:methylated-DNA--[protein]-cysteine S-methyltransferase [Solirubrobacterales bacterium]
MRTTHKKIDSPVGELTLVATDGTLSGIYFPGHWTLPDPSGFGPRTETGFEEAERQLAEYFAGDRTVFELETGAVGDGFQRQVWDRLERIPFGETTTYGEIAAELGDPNLARAVGTAVGRNPISVIVPCHRVLGKGGKLTGYAGGLDRKRFLLELEAPDGVLEGAGPTLF